MNRKLVESLSDNYCVNLVIADRLQLSMSSKNFFSEKIFVCARTRYIKLYEYSIFMFKFILVAIHR